jgi:hypothetical protein
MRLLYVFPLFLIFENASAFFVPGIPPHGVDILGNSRCVAANPRRGKIVMSGQSQSFDLVQAKQGIERTGLSDKSKLGQYTKMLR